MVARALVVPAALVLVAIAAAMPATAALPLEASSLPGSAATSLPDQLPSVPHPEAPDAPALPGTGSTGVGAPGNGAVTPSPVPPGFVSPPGNWDATALVVGFAGVASLAGLAVFGGTRFRSTEEVLEHEVRSKIYRHIEQNVGVSLKDLTEHLGLSTTNAVWHLRKLEESGLIRGRKFNGAKVYYPTAGGVQARNLSIASAALTSGNARTVLAFVHERPGIHQREVARLLGLNHGTVRWHLKKLRNAELLEERRTGPHASYYATLLGVEALRAVAQKAPSEQPAPGVAPDTAFSPAAGQA